jgi:hypothetical protein
MGQGVTSQLITITKYMENTFNMSTVITGKFSKKEPKEDKSLEIDPTPMDFDAVIKANADKKAKEAEERLKKNKQVLKDYKIGAKPDPKKK